MTDGFATPGGTIRAAKTSGCWIAGPGLCFPLDRDCDDVTGLIALAKQLSIAAFGSRLVGCPTIRNVGDPATRLVSIVER